MAASALAGSPEQKTSIGSWTVRNFARLCQNDGSVCMYTFGIEEDPDSCIFSPCVFTVAAADGKPANQSDFQQVECPNMEWFTYKVNGGWDPRGYMTIVVTNTDRQADAYFSFQDQDIEKAQVVASLSSPAYHVGTFSKARGEIARRGSDGEEEIGAWWQIQDMLRRTFPCAPGASILSLTLSLSFCLFRPCLHSRVEVDPTTGIVDMTFSIRTSEGGNQSCEILLMAPDPVTAQNWSFYNQPCWPHTYWVSWGYYEDTGAGIVTLCG